MLHDLAVTKDVESRATPGPWHTEPSKHVSGRYVIDTESRTIMHVTGPVHSPADAEFIAHARTAVPALVAAVERVQALHTPHRRPGHASDGTCESCYRVYPCPTIRELETPK